MHKYIGTAYVTHSVSATHTVTYMTSLCFRYYRLKWPLHVLLSGALLLLLFVAVI